jgi:alanyl-tRNA synthetase
MSGEEVRTHSALHVLKGAAQSVLGAKVTTSTYVDGRHGRLTVQFDRAPTEDELARVEHAANRKVSEGVELVEFEMDREEAEKHFGDQIYDRFPIPESVTRLRIVRIPDWNVNCCIEQHVDSTTAVGRIKLGRPRFRGSRKELELDFELTD